MKIYVKASLKSFSAALEDLLDDLESGLFEEFSEDAFDFTFAINKEHRCVDVFKDGEIYAQVYPQYQRASKPYDKKEFKYVGEGKGNYIFQQVEQGKGDYIRNKRKTAKPLYDADDFYIKYIDFTSKS